MVNIHEKKSIKPLFFCYFFYNVTERAKHLKFKAYIIIFLFFREVNEDNQLIRNVLVEFEDSLKYVSLK